MTICHIFNEKCQNRVVSSKSTKGFKMSMIIKNAESLFEIFESNIGIWAEKIF